MASDDQLLSYAELIDEIRSACISGTSGTLLIISEENQLVRLILDEGHISGMICGTLRGMDVVPKLRKLNACQLKLSANVIGRIEDDSLLPTDQILAQLEPRAVNELGETTIDTIDGSGIPAALNIIEEELIEFLGPMASVVWEEELDAMAQPLQPSDLKTLINNLSKEIDDADSIQTFRERIEKGISSL